MLRIMESLDEDMAIRIRILTSRMMLAMLAMTVIIHVENEDMENDYLQNVETSVEMGVRHAKVVSIRLYNL